MKKVKRILVVLALAGIVGITIAASLPKEKKEKSHYVEMETRYGPIKILLYNQTPLHRDNFLKLVDEGFYDSLLFHRVIKDFMIQGGDPESKGAPADKLLGNGGPGYKIAAEFDSTLFHKKGALAAAREGDNINPEKKSSGSQFYIVQGTVFSPEQLLQMEEKINTPKKQKVFYEYVNRDENAGLKSRLDSLNNVRDFEALNQEIQDLLVILEPILQENKLFHYSPEQKQIYSTLGGTPHLDQNYTVFGEVVEGLHLIDSIAQLKTDNNNRPLEDVMMKMKVVKR